MLTVHLHPLCFQFPTQLLYRATTHGWTVADWIRHLGGHGPTMTLVRVKDTDFIFGAYTSVPWPKLEDMPKEDERYGSPTTDPQSQLQPQCFMFSLVNAQQRPLRFLLQHPISVSCKRNGSTTFGLWSCTLELMMNKPGNEPESNASRGLEGNTHYKLDVQSELEAGLEPPNFSCGPDFLAGSTLFACAEIEVYGIPKT
jgi:hypothetical protein